MDNALLGYQSRHNVSTSVSKEKGWQKDASGAGRKTPAR
jgi:hypothetical protein